MKLGIKTYFLAALAIGSGLIVLLGYFFDFPLLADLRATFLFWTVVLASFLLLVGALNLLRTHWRKLKGPQPAGIYSLVLLLSFFATLIALSIEQLGLFGASGWSLWTMLYVVNPVESSLMAVLAVVLIYSLARLLQRRLNTFSLVFLATTVFVLIGSATFPDLEIPALRATRDWLVQVPAVAGGRGILLGVGLGAVAAGLRVLMGADRPYGG